MSLTEVAIRKAKPREKAYKLADEKGLFLLVKPNDSKYWRLKYRFNGKEKLLALGVYPDTNLANAREKRDEAHRLLANNVDPGIAKQTTKRSAQLAAENTFEAIGREWFAKFSVNWVEEHSDKIIRHAIATARAKHDPTRDLKGALPPIKENHFPTITDPEKISRLLRAIDSYMEM